MRFKSNENKGNQKFLNSTPCLNVYNCNGDDWEKVRELRGQITFKWFQELISGKATNLTAKSLVFKTNIRMF